MLELLAAVKAQIRLVTSFEIVIHGLSMGLIDGHDIAGVTLDSLRAQEGMVTQDTSLLHRSVCDNIPHGRPDAGDAAMHAAATRAEADGFIAGLGDAKGRAHPAAGRSHQRA